MAVRFRKSVKLGPGVRVNFSKSGMSTTIGPRGFTTSIGKNGVYRNVGIPGTGISYRTKVGDGKSKARKTAGSTARSAASQQPAAVREWQAYTGQSNPGVELHMDETGAIRFFDGNGSEITDPNLIAIIKRTPQYKAELPALKERQRAAVASLVEEKEQENATFIKAYTHAPQVLNRRHYELQLQRLAPEHYEPQPYTVPAPTQADVQVQLSEEADRNVKGAPWKRKKLKEQYFAERFQDRFNTAVTQWQQQKASFEDAESAKAIKLNAEYQAEYESLRTSYEMALAGDAEYIEAASEQWIGSCELPVEIATQFEYRPAEKCLMVDLDLPEIEDLPTETAVQMANGSLKVKDKTQKALRAEYAECVFGLAVFVAASLFNASPEIETVTVSGYTQRRNKAGDIVDDYILSIRFIRDAFYNVDYKTMVPEAFCLSFENRCNVTTTKVFKTIEPYA